MYKTVSSSGLCVCLLSAVPGRHSAPTQPYTPPPITSDPALPRHCRPATELANHVYIVSLIGGFAKRAHPARARYLNVNLAQRNRDLQPGGKEIEGGGRGGGEEEKEEKSDSWSSRHM